MRYRESRLGCENIYEIADGSLSISSRSWTAVRQERSIPLQTLDSNITRQWQRNQRVKNALVLSAVLGIVLIVGVGLLMAERLLAFNSWFIFSLVGACLLLAVFGLANPFREEYVLFSTRAGVQAFWVRRQKGPEFDQFVATLIQAISRAGT